MKTWMWTAMLGSQMLLTQAQAEPMHGKKAVDLDAAAKATAALYASMLAAPTVAPAQTATAISPAAMAPALKPQPVPSRPSPLLPPVVATNTTASPAPAPAGEVWQGTYQCERAEKVQLRPDAVTDQVQLHWKGQNWSLRRIDSQSGAMRLEDAQARMVWIQLPNKSMLLDQRQGKRLLDDCQHAVQVQTAAQMKTNPPPALFDTTGMGR